MRNTMFLAVVLTACSAGEGTLDVTGNPTNPTGTITGSSPPTTGVATGPSCVITDPVDGFGLPFTEPSFNFQGTGSDPVDGALSGDDLTWTIDGVERGTGGLLTNIWIEMPGDHEVSCTATNRAGESGTDTITVVVLSPVAAIWHPGDGEVRDVASDVPFTGEGADYEDGGLWGQSLQWTSDIDGWFGEGGDFFAPLSAGTHILTLTATDQDGNTGTDSITLTLE
jgi:hypothetical protein